jgi:hypothetical protein
VNKLISAAVVATLCFTAPHAHACNISPACSSDDPIDGYMRLPTDNRSDAEREQAHLDAEKAACNALPTSLGVLMCRWDVH